jgi:hypothetical protein
MRKTLKIGEVREFHAARLSAFVATSNQPDLITDPDRQTKRLPVK